MMKTSRPTRLNAEPVNILRWEDDGRKIIEIIHATLDQKRIKQ